MRSESEPELPGSPRPGSSGYPARLLPGCAARRPVPMVGRAVHVDPASGGLALVPSGPDAFIRRLSFDRARISVVRRSPMLRSRSLTVVVVVLAAVVVVRLVDPRGSPPRRDAPAVSPTTTPLPTPQDAISTPPTTVTTHRESPSPLSAAAKFSPILVTLAGHVTGNLPDGDYASATGSSVTSWRCHRVPRSST